MYRKINIFIRTSHSAILDSKLYFLLTSIGKNGARSLPLVLSISYIIAIFSLPAFVNFGLCNTPDWKNICQFLPTQNLTEFDKWGSYLSGALVPLSLIWVGMAFRLQQRQLYEQGKHQADAAKIAYESQKITDRQTLTSMASTYIQRMETALQKLAGLIDSNAPRTARGEYGPVLNPNRKITSKDVANVFRTLHNTLVAIRHGEIADHDLRSTKSLFVDSDISDYLDSFFNIYNEYYRRCETLDCLILIPPNIISIASDLKYSILRSTCRWHTDERERNRLKCLIGWTDVELERYYAENPEDKFLEPFDPEKYHQRK